MLSYHEFMTDFCDRYLRHEPWPGSYWACQHSRQKGGPHWVRPVAGVVYYAYFAESELIKIGSTTGLRGRMQQLKPSAVLALEETEEITPCPRRRAPWGLGVALNSLQELEYRRHEQHAASHCHGEFFHATDELIGFIADLGYDFAAAVERRPRCAPCEAETSWAYRCSECGLDKHYTEFATLDPAERVGPPVCALCREHAAGTNQPRLVAHRRRKRLGPKPCAHRALVA